MFMYAISAHISLIPTSLFGYLSIVCVCLSHPFLSFSLCRSIYLSSLANPPSLPSTNLLSLSLSLPKEFPRERMTNHSHSNASSQTPRDR